MSLKSNPVIVTLGKIAGSVGRFFLRPVFRMMVIACAVLGFGATVAVWFYVLSSTRELPSESVLAEYNPEVTTRVHAGDGLLIAEFASEHRIYVPYEAIPEHVIWAFISAEDKSFFTHGGIDYFGMIRANLRNLRNYLAGADVNLQGGSTITQQVMKNMVLEDTSQVIDRKIREMVLARRGEQAFSKEKILELYLNEIYLGGSSYGVASAALNYFNKSLPELTVEEAAVLAAMAQRPGDVNPFLKPERSKIRRNYVLGRMAINGHISREEAEEAQAQPLVTRERLKGPEYAAATYFVEELRRDLSELVGEEELKADGLSIRSTLDTRLQLAAQDALQSGLETYDRRHGYRGPLTTLELGDGQLEALAQVELPGGYGSKEAALVLTATNSAVRLLLNDGFEIDLAPDDVEWSRSYRPEGGGRGLSPGDVVMVAVEREVEVMEGEEIANPAGDPVESEEISTQPETDADEEDELAVEEPVAQPVGDARLGQIPEVEGALLALDPHTGRILAMAGGYSFWKSQFNRTVQAYRQPGSSFKPYVYAAALELGDPRTGRAAFSPVSKILDAPFIDCDYTRVEDQCWSPTNYTSGRFYGQSTMRVGLELSRNAMTVRLAQDIGMPQVARFVERLGLVNELEPYLPMSLGAKDVTVWNMAKSYAAFVNGGKQVTPTLFDRVQDREGNTLFRMDDRECPECNAEYEGQAPPVLADVREQVIDPITAFQITYMLQGVVERGTAAGIRRGCPGGGPQAALGVEDAATLCKHTLGGKTGTTNDYKDAWFMGFSPDLVVGIYVGFDEPESMGNGESGGRVAAPIFGEFMDTALESYDPIPFRDPSGIRFMYVDSDTGAVSAQGRSGAIREAFRRGSEPGFEMDVGQGLGSLIGDVNTNSGIGDLPTDPIDGPVLPGTRPSQSQEDEDLDGIY
ncbi:MAG: penicillin-binding protein [Ponticaulis sp.]|nr:penicillin-binding protein [Ponticaulis sp.]|tara:strand:+ start:19065 stop:21821 length:2757 start_codon:yes stop_codon:yes gene_type:complete